MEKRIYICGFGGQGVMLIGKLLCQAAFYEGSKVLFYPSYGGEQRGGASNCTIIVSDEEVGAPSVRFFDICVFMNDETYRTYGSCVKPGGIAILNTSFIKEINSSLNVRNICIDATAEADGMGIPKAANMVMLGALTIAAKAAGMGSIMRAMEKKLASKPQLISMNEKAISRGRELAAKQME
jgi:2-oxoglutarate ferredoxin oxidoreductase subunit gamma